MKTETAEKFQALARARLIDTNADDVKDLRDAKLQLEWYKNQKIVIQRDIENTQLELDAGKEKENEAREWITQKDRILDMPKDREMDQDDRDVLVYVEGTYMHYRLFRFIA